jgi:hypothetical protein
MLDLIYSELVRSLHSVFLVIKSFSAQRRRSAKMMMLMISVSVAVVTSMKE